MNPIDYDVPSEFRHWSGDAAEDRVGPFFFYIDEGIVYSAFRLRHEHCNSHESAHGGILMMFADYSLCIAANGGAEESVATVSCNNEFVGPAVVGDLICGRAEVTRRGGSLVFARVQLSVNKNIILNGSGVIKRLRPKQA
ncbi:MAG: PaaI family thioesterase [Gammaproteobacteria bacterium]